MAKQIKTAAAVPKKTSTTHPRTGRQFSIDAAIYDPIKAAILQSLKGSTGKTFSELTDDVVTTMRNKMPVPPANGVKKSIPWYTITVRLDLETKGIVETFTEKGKKLNRLKKK